MKGLPGEAHVGFEKPVGGNIILENGAALNVETDFKVGLKAAIRDITTCPCCNQGKMKLLAEIPMYRARAPNNRAGVAA